MIGKLILIALLGLYLNDTRSSVNAQTAGTPKTPFIQATATSTYANNDNCYGPKFVIDGYSDRTGCNFFHSKATVPYPYVSTVLTPSTVNSVTLKSRCDANGWGHTQFTVVVRAGTTAVAYPTTNAGTSLLTQNTLCGSFTGRVAQCSDVTITCASAITAASVLTVQLYTNGRNVHLMFEDVSISSTAAATATSSSVYYNRYGDFSAYWGPAFAVDGAQSSTWYGMFHSAHEPYPWLKLKLPGATGTDTTVNSVTLRSRCDANAWSCSVPNTINVQVQAGKNDVAAGFKGQINNGNTVCGVKVGCDAAACQTHTITCPSAIASHYITVQMLDATNTFLMLDEVTWA